MPGAIPDDIQRLILDKLPSPQDHARSSCVCKLWYSIYKERTFSWFVAADHGNNNHMHGFFSVYDHKMYRFSAPDLEGRYICGSSHGWLVTIDNDHVFGLYDPFSRTCIQLPPSPIKEHFIFHKYRGRKKGIDPMSLAHKVIFSCNPKTNPKECIIMCLYCNDDLAFCKLGDKCWTRISHMIDGEIFQFQDVTFCNSNFFVASRSQVYVVHVNPEPHFTPFGPKMSVRTRYPYLVNLDGDLIIVDRYLYFSTNSGQTEQIDNAEDQNEDEYISRSRFDVYKLDKDVTRWRKENEIGDKILFLGFNESIALSTPLVPNSIADTIYYRDPYTKVNCRHVSKDQGIFHFHLKGRKHTLIYPRQVFDHLTSATHIWLIQN